MYTSSIVILAASASLAIARPQEAAPSSNTLLPSAAAAALVPEVHSDGSPYFEVKTATSFTGTVYTTAFVTNTKTVDCVEGTMIFNATTAYPTPVPTSVPVPDLPTTIMTSGIPQQTGEGVSSIPPPTFPGMHSPPANGTFTYSYDPSSMPYPAAPTGGAAAQSSGTKAAHSAATATPSSSSGDDSFGQGATSAASASFASTERVLVSLVALVIAGLVL